MGTCEKHSMLLGQNKISILLGGMMVLSSAIFISPWKGSLRSLLASTCWDDSNKMLMFYRDILDAILTHFSPLIVQGMMMI